MIIKYTANIATTRITIADKNLWATTVWNNWDTLSEANCWKYYQRWNNYWFPFTWSVTTSSTKVDASSYWPWNYYSRNVFVTIATSPYSWDSSNNQDLRWWVTWIINGGGDIQVRPYKPKKDYLCFTANTAGSTIKLTKLNTPTAVTMETSTDGINWSSYNITTNWVVITLSNVWDKVYFRNASETTTWFSTSTSYYYNFVMTWSISWSWDVTSLINKNCTTTLWNNYCFCSLFEGCASLTTPPRLPATTLTRWCYYNMFWSCTWLTTAPELPAITLGDTYTYYRMFYKCTSLSTLPKLPALTLTNYCYQEMFYNCSNIKISSTQTWIYQTPYRIPVIWTWTATSSSLTSMFAGTWWTFTSKPSINTTYYASNTVV